MMIYRIYEGYFSDLLSLIDTGVLIDEMFKLLEESHMFQSVFKLGYSELKGKKSFLGLTDKVAYLMKNDNQVLKAKKKVSCIVLII